MNFSFCYKKYEDESGTVTEYIKVDLYGFPTYFVDLKTYGEVEYPYLTGKSNYGKELESVQLDEKADLELVTLLLSKVDEDSHVHRHLRNLLQSEGEA